ncbi:MAG: hypothetical protein KR126chlam1_00810 [Chlamydiae bacterium]|nr:hypothetical protein [Chlamydiota bacterium]
MNLVEKIEKVEALLKGAKTAGEKEAAKRARARLLKKNAKHPIEYSVRVDSPWKKRLFVALCAKHNLRAYRYKGQKHTTSMVMVSKYFMDEVLWPEFKKYAKIFEELANDILGDLISQIHETSEEVVISGELPQKNALQV